tara:strand:+ start:230 stop:1027 length:798 start_codon:yes stop_codon:yes gene_type:complete
MIISKKNPYNQSNYSPFFSIVTPVYNGEKYLEQTIKSVIGQTLTDFEYIIVDNLSNDNSRKIIERYSSKVDKIIFEKDESMYDALNKGFSNCKGKYLYWINSDDYLFNKDVLMNLKNYLIKNPQIEWLNGKTSFKYEKYNFSLSFFPYVYPANFIKRGFAHLCGWGFIQQESTMFSKKIFIKSEGFDKNKKMAGDYFLWKKLSEKNDLIPVNLPIGVHRKWDGQMTDLNHYYKEINKQKCIFSFLKIIRFFYSLVFFFINKIFSK